jgi:hypothetical protein
MTASPELALCLWRTLRPSGGHMHDLRVSSKATAVLTVQPTHHELDGLQYYSHSFYSIIFLHATPAYRSSTLIAADEGLPLNPSKQWPQVACHGPGHANCSTPVHVSATVHLHCIHDIVSSPIYIYIYNFFLLFSYNVTYNFSYGLAQMLQHTQQYMHTLRHVLTHTSSQCLCETLNIRAMH